MKYRIVTEITYVVEADDAQEAYDKWSDANIDGVAGQEYNADMSSISVYDSNGDRCPTIF